VDLESSSEREPSAALREMAMAAAAGGVRRDQGPYLASVPDQPELLTNHCPCGVSWWGILRAHCCERSGGCGEVFDDGELFDQHRLHGECGWPSRLGLVRNKGGIWHRRGDQAS
jgi:hypothetical protein